MRLSSFPNLTLAHAAAVAAAVTLVAPTLAHAQSPTWDSWKSAKDPEARRVLQYLEAGDGRQLVVLDAGRQQGILAGAVLKTYRATVSPAAATTLVSASASASAGNYAAAGAGAAAPLAAAQPLWIETGRLKAIDVQDDRTVASVEVQSSALSRAFFPKFPGVMAGDLALMPKLLVARKQTVLPTMTLTYHSIFQDPKGSPATFELKSEGFQQLRDAAKTFADARVSLLMVEGYTDHHGPSQANQVESYQRAMTVRQFLIDELGFDEQRVVAVGYGEGEPADETMTPGFDDANRRIVLKAVPIRQ